MSKDNAVVLCPTHHRLFDRGLLDPAGLKRIRRRLVAAAKKGHLHPRYPIRLRKAA